MGVGVGQAGAIEFDPPEAAEPELFGIERGVLAGEDEHALQPLLGQRGSDGGQFDGFGPGADDQPHLSVTQHPP
jgi:hypothetical protein